MTYIKCPFCNEDDFDLVGLKHHLISGHCEVYEVTISNEEEMKFIRSENNPIINGEEICSRCGEKFITAQYKNVDIKPKYVCINCTK